MSDLLYWFQSRRQYGRRNKFPDGKDRWAIALNDPPRASLSFVSVGGGSTGKAPRGKQEKRRVAASSKTRVEPADLFSSFFDVLALPRERGS